MGLELKHIALEDISKVVDAIFEMGEKIPVWTFEGNLGAGKTTLIKEIAKRMQLKDDVASPTFNYVNDYDGKVYHFDCYRIEDITEALNFGFEEYLDSGKRCWIEWPEIILPLIQDPYLKIDIFHNSDQTRSYTFSIVD